MRSQRGFDSCHAEQHPSSASILPCPSGSSHSGPLHLPSTSLDPCPSMLKLKREEDFATVSLCSKLRSVFFCDFLKLYFSSELALVASESSPSVLESLNHLWQLCSSVCLSTLSDYSVLLSVLFCRFILLSSFLSLFACLPVSTSSPLRLLVPSLSTGDDG